MRLPDGYRTERPAPTDVAEILDLVRASDIAALGYPDVEEHEVAGVLAGPDNDRWLVRDAGGRLVGWGFVEMPGWFCEAYARPGEDAPVQEVLIDLLLAGIAERVEGPVIVRAGAIPSEEQYVKVLTGAGFELERQQARMSRPLTGDERPEPAAGYRVRAATAEELPACNDVLRTAFADDVDYAATPGLVLEECLVAEADDERAGVLLSTAPAEDTNEGWVKWLGVRPEHRKRGVAAALLSTAIAANSVLGRPSIGLGVNTSSATRAFDLYERLGFVTVYRSNIYRRAVEGRIIGT
ncbi:GNAT family N-acetyltransferase [Kutzneria buriramensis]|uniref:Acetyltransferase (GNAT) family protein n=1 Tax=Kutzneria buriramensis TaxID=1045776 RepID=A0A3E0HGN6_9PSEU|nr:GNAT family N-acetyltransferase [Kutzneria buriramensis]REH44843.1 acetyltransferase (GNAT) family protein [Kutzneria buriramensis]